MLDLTNNQVYLEISILILLKDNEFHTHGCYEHISYKRRIRFASCFMHLVQNNFIEIYLAFSFIILHLLPR